MMPVLETLNLVQLHRHQQHYISSVLIGTKHRCTFCGHRLTVNGVAPVETRKLPPTRWIPELVDRKRAMAQFSWEDEQLLA